MAVAFMKMVYTTKMNFVEFWPTCVYMLFIHKSAGLVIGLTLTLSGLKLAVCWL